MWRSNSAGAEGQYRRFGELAADLVRRRVSVIVTPGSATAALAAKAATTTIPIVFGAGGAPRGLRPSRGCSCEFLAAYPGSSRDRAARLRERVAAAFPDATLGRWHDALTVAARAGVYIGAPTTMPMPPPVLGKKLNGQGLNGDRAHRAAKTDALMISLEAA
jgi:hypothetical protein